MSASARRLIEIEPARIPLHSRLNIENYLVGLPLHSEEIGTTSKRAATNAHWAFKPVIVEIGEPIELAVLQREHGAIHVMTAPRKIDATSEVAAGCREASRKET